MCQKWAKRQASAALRPALQPTSLRVFGTAALAERSLGAELRGGGGMGLAAVATKRAMVAASARPLLLVGCWGWRVRGMP